MRYLRLILLGAAVHALPGSPSKSYHCDPKDPVLEILERCETKVAAAFCSSYLSIPKVTKEVTKTVYVTKSRTTQTRRTITSTVLTKTSRTSLTTITSTATKVGSTETDTLTVSTTESDLGTVTTVASTETDLSLITATTSTEVDTSTETDTLTITTTSTDVVDSTTTTTTTLAESTQSTDNGGGNDGGAPAGKRDDNAQVKHFQARNVPLPPYLHGKAPSAVSSACSCLNIAKATTTCTKTVIDTIQKTKTDSLISVVKKTKSTSATQTVDQVSTQTEVSTTTTTQSSIATQSLTTTISETSTTTSTQTSDVAYTSDTTSTTVTTIPVTTSITTTSVTTSTTTSTVIVPSCASFYIQVSDTNTDVDGQYAYYDPNGNEYYDINFQDFDATTSTLFTIDPNTFHLSTTYGVVGAPGSVGLGSNTFAYLTVQAAADLVNYASSVTCSGADVLSCVDSSTGAYISELCTFSGGGSTANNQMSLGTPKPAPGYCVAATFNVICFPIAG